MTSCTDADRQLSRGRSNAGPILCIKNTEEWGKNLNHENLEVEFCLERPVRKHGKEKLISISQVRIASNSSLFD